MLQLGHFERLQPSRAGHHQRHGLHKIGLIGGAGPVAQGLVQGRQGVAVLVVLRFEQGRQHGAAAFGPLLRRGGAGALLPPVHQGLQQVRQGPGQLGVQPAHLGIGVDACGIGHRVGPAGVPHEHALHAKQGRVVIATRGQAQACAVRGRQAPADARAGHPAGERGQLLGRQAKARSQRGHFEQRHQLAHAAALLGQSQQPLECVDQGAGGLRAQVGNVKGNEAGIAPLVLAKHGADGWGHDFDVGHHHHHIAR